MSWRVRLGRWAPWLGLALAALLVALDAEARVGGGQQYGGGGGGGSRGGGSYGGGGGGDGGEVLFRLLFYLLWTNPTVGVPLLAIVAVVVVLRARHEARQGPSRRTYEGLPHGAAPHRAAPRRADLAQRDPGWSEPVFHDFVQLVVRRVHAARTPADREALGTYVAGPVWAAVTDAGVTDVRDVIVAGSSIVSWDLSGDQEQLAVDVSTRRVIARGGRTDDLLIDERWTFARAAGSVSLPPEALRRLGCPSCGVASQPDPLGRCTSCGTPVLSHHRQWRAVAVDERSRRPNHPPEISRWTAEEPGYRAFSVVDPELPAETRAFHGRHPGFDGAAWEARVRGIFLRLQDAWSRGAWEEARPHCTDAAWNTLRFWMLRYRDAGLRNRVEDVAIERIQVVRIAVDAYHEATTVRFWAHARDWTEDETGTVVGGNPKAPRHFSEYWTFLRAIGSGEAIHDAGRCPSCGAPLDRIEQTGRCGYCDSIVTTGQHDWVLSRIEQPGAYRG